MNKILGTALVLTTALCAGAEPREPIADDLITTPGVAFESYLARWWGAPGSWRRRPIYRIARFDAEAFQLHYGIVPGRDLDDYTMPYGHIRSVLSIVDGPTELAEQVQLDYHDGVELQTTGFTPRSGVELAGDGSALAVKIRNRSIAAPEDVTTKDDKDYAETNPLSLEQTFVLRKGDPALPVHCRLANAGGAALRDVAVSFAFEQSFGWGRFGVAEDAAYVPLQAPAEGSGRAFYAFSEGRQCGYAFTAGEGITLTYELSPDMNHWRVNLSYTAGEVAPSAAHTFEYTIETLEAVPESVDPAGPGCAVDTLAYRRFQPASFRVSPVRSETRVPIADQVAGLDRAKVRGLNLREGFPQAFTDLETLRDWGCNFIITSIGDPDQTAQFIEHGHGLGMEMLLAGRGGFHDGPPQFDAYYAEPRTAEQIPDGHGQDEDHYYWYAIEPTRSFESEFGKPMAQATHDEEVVYWARCFADKWRGVQDSLRPHAPDTGLWFYAPFPGIAYVDPVDSYDLFLGTLAQELGDALTALPFYYGMEYNQAEYIVRRWKDAGAARVVFLPMRDFVAKPSQFIRAITAARRGGADGTCGFNFAVGDGEPQDQWQWKAVMLAAWANFPTPDLDAYSLMEEPAELVEHLAQSGLQVRVESKAGDFDASGMLAQLREALPGARSAHGDSQAAHLTILVTNRPPALGNPDALGPAWRAGKGFLRMDGRTLHLSGANAEALGHACNLLLRFAEVARHESEIPAPPGLP